MADPISLTAGASLGASALGGITSFFGSQTKAAGDDIATAGAQIKAAGAQFSADAESKAYTYKSGVALLNKRISNINADYAVASGEVKAQQAGMATRFQIGTTTAIQGASGLDVRGGSAVDVRTSEAELGDYSQATIRNDAAREAFGFNVQGLQYEAESELDKAAATNAKTAGAIAAAGYEKEAEGYKVAKESDQLSGFSSLLGSAGSVAKTAAGFKIAGIM